MSNQNQINLIFKGAGFLFIGIIISKILSYFYRFYAARVFGPEIYGIFSLGLAFIGFFGIIGLLGVHFGIIRFVPEYLTKRKKGLIKGVIFSSLKLSFVASIIVTSIVLLIAPLISINIYNEIQLIPFLQIMALSIPFNSIIYIFISAFTGFKNVKYGVFIENVLYNLLKLIIIVITGLVIINPLIIPLSFTIGIIISAIVAFYLFESRVFSLFNKKVKSISHDRDLLIYSLPLLFTGFLGAIFLYIDTFMLGMPFLNINSGNPINDVGIYNAAMPTAQFLMIIPLAFTTLLIPIITEFYIKKMIKDIEIVYKVVTRWIFYFNFPFFLLMVFFADNIIKVLWGTSYIDAQSPLIILSFGFLLMSLTQALVYIFNVTKNTKQLIYISSANTTLNLLLNLILIPMFSFVGAAYATSLTYLFNMIFVIIISRRYLKINFFSNDIFKAIAAGFMSIVTIYYVAITFFGEFSLVIMLFLFLLFVFLYSTFLSILKAFRDEDIKILNAIERKTGINLSFIKRLLIRK